MKKLIALLGLSFLGFVGVANATTVTVTANPLWTDTGIVLSGETITITATGEWNTGLGWSGPEGLSFPSLAYDEFVPDGQHGELIGRVNDFYFAIGTGGTFSGLFGELWLGFNDDSTSGNVYDNSGTVSATITTSGSVPDAASTLMLLGGAFGLVGLLRRKNC